MAEFCLKCFNTPNGTDYKAHQVWLEEDLCEGCGEWKPCVMELQPKPLILRAADWMKNLFKMRGMRSSDRLQRDKSVEAMSDRPESDEGMNA